MSCNSSVFIMKSIKVLMLTYFSMSPIIGPMNVFARTRHGRTLSQRGLSQLSGLSFRTVQLLESGRHDPKLSTLTSVANALGYPEGIIEDALERIFSQPPDAVCMIAARIATGGDDAWKVWLFNFVDAFRSAKDRAYIDTPPASGISTRLLALIASTVETLCDELALEPPSWCRAVCPLKDPWFVSGVENLKAMALVESPIHFRKRNIFVLENFLSRR